MPTSDLTFPHLRPIAMGEEIVNSAIGGAYYPVNAPSGTVINAYLNAGAWSAALVNTTASSITVTVEFPSSGGTMPQTAETVLYTNGMDRQRRELQRRLRRRPTRRSLHLGHQRHADSARLLSGRYPLTRRWSWRIGIYDPTLSEL